MKRKIVYVNHSAGLGGADLSLLSIVMHVAGNPENDVLVVLPGDGPLKGILKEKGIEVVERSIQSWRFWTTSASEWMKAVVSFPLVVINFFRWVSFFNKLSPDLVHFNLNRIIEPALAARVVGVPSIMHFRDIPARIRPSFVYGNTIFYWLLNKCTVWIANSDATYEAIVAKRKGEITIVPNGIDFNEYIGLKQNRNKDTIVLAMIGTLTEWKNQKDFIELAERLRNVNVRCWIVGEGPTREMLATLIRQKRLEDLVEMKGFVSDMPSLLANVDIVVHTMAGESFGRVFVEAAAAALPVVAYRSGGASEIIVDGQSGFLVDDFDVDILEACVLKLVDDKNLRVEMGANGKRIVEQKFSIEETLKRLTEVYTTLLKEREV